MCNSLNKTPVSVEVVLSPRTYKSKLTCFIMVFSLLGSSCVHSCLPFHSLYLYSTEDSVERCSFELPAGRSWAPHYLCRHGPQLGALCGLRVTGDMHLVACPLLAVRPWGNPVSEPQFAFVFKTCKSSPETTTN